MRETLLINTFVELADVLVDDFDVVDLLTQLAGRCVEVLDVDAAGIMLASADGELRVVASSSEAMRTLELFELQASEGPCFECYLTGEPTANVRLTADVATIGILQHRAVEEAHTVNDQLTSALNSRIIVEQAKGMVAERTGLDMGAAFNQLRNHARRRNLLLSDLARLVVAGEVGTGSLDVEPERPPSRRRGPT